MKRLAFLLSSAALLAAICEPANATVFDFTTTDVSVQQYGLVPPPSDFIGGTITLSNSVLPGAQFSSANVTALSFTFLGVTGTLTDGKSFSTFEFDGGFQTSVSPDLITSLCT
jgi:hypothetical protein